jgi:hypothetical protein
LDGRSDAWEQASAGTVDEESRPSSFIHHWEGQPLALLKRWRAVFPSSRAASGNVAVLGNEHPGLFAPNSLDEYRSLLVRSVRDDAFRNNLIAVQERSLKSIPDAPHVAKQLGRLYAEIRA